MQKESRSKKVKNPTYTKELFPFASSQFNAAG